MDGLLATTTTRRIATSSRLAPLPIASRSVIKLASVTLAVAWIMQKCYIFRAVHYRCRDVCDVCSQRPRRKDLEIDVGTQCLYFIIYYEYMYI